MLTATLVAIQGKGSLGWGGGGRSDKLQISLLKRKAFTVGCGCRCFCQKEGWCIMQEGLRGEGGLSHLVVEVTRCLSLSHPGQRSPRRGKGPPTRALAEGASPLLLHGKGGGPSGNRILFY